MKIVRLSLLDKLNLFQTSIKLDPEKVNCQAKSVIAAVLTTLNDAGVSLAPAQRIQRNLGLSNHLWAAATKGVDASAFLQRIQRKDARAGRQYFWLVVLPGESAEEAMKASLASMRTLPLPTNLTYRARHLAALYTLEKLVLGASSVEVPDVETPDDEVLDGEVLSGETLQGETLPPRVLDGEGLSFLSCSSSSHEAFQSKEAAATRTHESAHAHEGQPPAAGQGLDLEKPDRGRQAAASEQPAQTSTAATQDEPGEELVVWLGTTLKTRQAALVRSVGEVKPSQVKPCLRTLKRWAAGDEARVRAYLADELDRQEGRDAHERASTVSVLVRWLADRKAWERWQVAGDAGVATAPGAVRDRSIPVGRPPRPGMRWEPAIGKWVNSNSIYTGLKLPGRDEDDVIDIPTVGEEVAR